MLPRLRYGRTILAPARWRLSAADLPGSDAADSTWTHQFTELRQRYRIPATVHLTAEGPDVRIGLDLDESRHLALLRAHLDRTGSATLTERWTHTRDGRCANGWIGHRPHEVVVPLAATHPPQPTPLTHPRAPIHTRHHGGHIPGASVWLYAKLYGHPERQDELLTTHLPRLLSTWPDAEPDVWWFLRHRDPEAHLRLRIRLRGASDYGAAVQQLGTWAEALRTEGRISQLVFDTYYPETGRYGPGALMETAETTFAADSALALTQLAATRQAEGVDVRALTATSMTGIAAAFTGDVDAGMDWLIEHATTPDPTPPDRTVREQTVRLADPRRDWAALSRLPEGAALTHAWQRRHTALAAYRAQLDAAAEAPAPDGVLASLLHLHHARMIGLDPACERTCLRLARAAALRWNARTLDR